MSGATILKVECSDSTISDGSFATCSNSGRPPNTETVVTTEASKYNLPMLRRSFRRRYFSSSDSNIRDQLIESSFSPKRRRFMKVEPSSLFPQAQNQRNNLNGLRFSDSSSSASTTTLRNQASTKNAKHQSIKNPNAPSNTTQFLITDREERESSVPADNKAAVEEVETTQSPWCHIEESNGEEDRDPEFSQVYDNVNMERIECLSREKVNKELLIAQNSNRQLEDKNAQLLAEIHRLNKILSEHGIECELYSN